MTDLIDKVMVIINPQLLTFRADCECVQCRDSRKAQTSVKARAEEIIALVRESDKPIRTGLSELEATIVDALHADLGVAMALKSIICRHKNIAAIEPLDQENLLKWVQELRRKGCR